MSASQNRRIVRWISRTSLAIFTGLALLTSTHGPAAGAVPRQVADDPAWQPPAERSVPGTDARPVPVPADPGERFDVRTAPTVTWPSKGVAQARPATGTWLSQGSVGQVPLVAAELGRAGSLPVWLAAGSAQTPSQVRVESLGRSGDALLLTLARSDGIAATGRVELQVSYEKFRHAYGGDWANRLRIVRAADGTAYPTWNDGKGVLSAEVPVTATPTTYAVRAAADGGTGDFKASSLSPSATWTVGGSSGDFNWSYPMDVPPSVGGPGPQVSLEYSSGGVDGRTTTTNNQPSWAGEGFELSPGGSIERRYASCATDKGGNNGTRITGDLCWKTDNAHFSLNGKGGELVQDDTTKKWRMRNDDGSKVEHLFNAVNGDDNGEYWKITTKDGTQYFFGLNRLPGWRSGVDPVTNAAYTVPVFGNHTGEPCNKPAFADSWCTQAYRLNLDHVVDPHGNTMSYFYKKESNYFGRNGTATTVSEYTRAGHIDRIEYGQRAGQVYTTPAVGRVLFTGAPRCIPGSACTTAQPATYPDTPTDQICLGVNGQPPARCDNKLNPVFFTTTRLAKVSTQVARGTAYTDVDSWTLRHTFRDPGDGTRAGLWLEGVTNAGHVGGGLQMPEVNFDGVALDNRVDAVGDGLPPMHWWRVNKVSYGTGGDLAIAYSGTDCAPGDVPAPADNARRCHPMKWTPPGHTTETTDWFHKYVVTSVVETDRVAQRDSLRPVPVVTTVEYPRPPSWHFDDADGLVDINQKTWAQWRGYDLVRTRKGSPDGTQTVTEQRFFRGMDGDRNGSGGTKDVKITDSTGFQVDDHAALPGQLREQSTFNGATLVERTITDQWVSTPTASRVKEWGTTTAHAIEEAGNKQVETVTGGGQRQSAAHHVYATDGTLVASNDLNDLATPADDTCTRHEYVRNDTLGIAELPKRSQTVSVNCDQPFGNAQVISDSLTYYDGATSPNTAPTEGNVTRIDRLAGFNTDGTPRYQTVSTATFDPIGRGLTSTDALGHTTRTAFNPSGAAPVLQKTVTQANGHKTVTDLEPAWGEELAVTDPAGRRIEATFDPLGRTTKVWLPGRSGASAPELATRPGANIAGLPAASDNAATPNMEYSYQLNVGQPSSISTKTLQTDGSLETTYELSDGLLRKRQTQEPAQGGGRIVTDIEYDSRGLPVKENGPYRNDGAPVGHTVVNPDEAILVAQKVTTFDGAERPVTETFRSLDQDRWVTRHSHSAEHQTIDPPSGDEPTTTFTDVQGRVTELRQHRTEAPSNSFDTTRYSYDQTNQLTAMTDPAGNRWSYEYDVRGRKIKEIDPDKGTTTYTYNDLDQMLTSTDGRGATLAYEYDAIGRKTKIRSGSATGPVLSEWSYDSLAAGSPTSSTRWVNGQPYTTRITGYAPNGQPLGSEVTIPASEGDLAGTYRTENTYNADGEIATTSVPAAGGLPAETLRYGYDKQDQPTTMASDLTSYVRGTTYTPFGEVEKITLGSTGGKWVSLAYGYEEGTRRLRQVVTERETSARRISDVGYEYDEAGNITKITDAPSATTGEATDAQCFDYDYLRRLNAAWTPADGNCEAAPTQAGLGGPAPYWHSWTFDVTGNRQSETRRSPTASTTATYTYPAAGQPRPHAVSQVVTTGAGGRTDSYRYDAGGNQIERTLGGVGETFDWDAEGNLEKVAGAGRTTNYVYDAEGQRLLRRDAAGVTLYLGDTEVLLKPGGQLEGTRYYRHGEQTVAIRTAGKLTWLGADHHGTSTTGIMDTAEQTVQRRRMDPYGNLRGSAPPAWPGQRGFVGGTTDPSTGLVHLGAREYDPTLGKFISVDPELDTKEPQTLNAYAYANNNPVTFSDPDGKFFGSIISAVKHVAKTVVKRTVETVKSVVKVVTPVIRSVVDKVSRAVAQVKTFVSKAVQVVKKVVKTVKTIVKQAIKTIKKVVKKVAKKIVSTVKKVGKFIAKNAKAAWDKGAKMVKAAANGIKNAGVAIGQAAQSAGKWVWEHRKEIAHFAIDVAVGAAAGVVGAAVCGVTAGLGCAVIVGGVVGMVGGGAANIGAAHLMGEEVTTGKVLDWTLGGFGGGAVGAVRKMVGVSGLDLFKAARKSVDLTAGGLRVPGGLRQTVEIARSLVTDPKMWTSFTPKAR